MDNKSEKSKLNPSVNRRTFLKVSGALASTAMAGPVFTKSKAAASPAVITGENLPDSVEIPDDIIYSVCQMCHSRCGMPR
jgi:anaerobic selenocysteine-containing dehydrogenase